MNKLITTEQLVDELLKCFKEHLDESVNISESNKHYDISTDKSTEVNTEVFNHYNTLESKA